MVKIIRTPKKNGQTEDRVSFTLGSLFALYTPFAAVISFIIYAAVWKDNVDDDRVKCARKQAENEAFHSGLVDYIYDRDSIMLSKWVNPYIWEIDNSTRGDHIKNPNLTR